MLSIPCLKEPSRNPYDYSKPSKGYPQPRPSDSLLVLRFMELEAGTAHPGMPTHLLLGVLRVPRKLGILTALGVDRAFRVLRRLRVLRAARRVLRVV